MAEGSSPTVVEFVLPDIDKLQDEHDSQSQIIVEIGKQEGIALSDLRSKFFSDDLGKDAAYLFNKELIEVYSGLLKKLEDAIKKLASNEEADNTDIELINSAVNELITDLRAGDERSGYNKKVFEGVASKLDRLLVMTGNNPMSTPWLPRKVRKEINDRLKDAKEAISKSEEVPAVIEKFRGIIDRILSIAQNIEDKLNEVLKSGKENVLKLAPLIATATFLQVLRDEFDRVAPDTEIDAEAIEAQVELDFAEDYKVILNNNKSAAIQLFADPNDDKAKMEQTKHLGAEQELKLNIQKEVAKRIEERKVELAREKGFPEGWINLQLQYEDVVNRRDALLLLAETQKHICTNVRTALNYLKRKKTGAEEDREESIKEMVALIVQQDLNIDGAITYFRSVDDKGSVTGLKPDDITTLGNYFGIDAPEIIQIIMRTTRELEAQKEEAKKPPAPKTGISPIDTTSDETKAPGYDASATKEVPPAPNA